MGYGVGYDTRWKRDIGYGIPATCDQPGCGAQIDRGLSYVCGDDLYGGEHGCGLYFCERHLRYTYSDDDEDLTMPVRCERCVAGEPPFPLTPDVPEWITHKLTDPSWQRWRDEHPDEVQKLTEGRR
ncbi:hypothetical protein [Nocardia sp. NPDC051833]|uniref:hypothetical protein n=1 Tax=Nocardia sp. NPDC051833 TaxID=3155674 RepID=UPI003422C1C9